MYGKTALINAAERWFAETIEFPVKSGADPRAKDNIKDTPLASGSMPTLQQILDTGAPPRTRGKATKLRRRFRFPACRA